MSIRFTKPQPLLDAELEHSGFKNAGPHRIMGVWLAANLVITTLLTGTLFVPSLSYTVALAVIIAGTALGALVLITVGSMGTRTGLTTMELTKFSFGIKGSLIPSFGNLIVLMGWSWVQAILAGVTVDTLITSATGYSNPALWSVVCEVAVVALALFGHTTISKVEPIFAILILTCMGYVIWECFKDIQLDSFWGVTATATPYTPGLAFDAVFATAISWTVLSADFNRYGANTKSTCVASFLGYCTSTILSMALGATLALYLVLVHGIEAPFNPVPLVETFGGILAVAVFLSVMATNTMVVYGMINSAISAFPRYTQSYRIVAGIIGLISIAGASQVGLLDYFTSFLLLIGAFFVPVFAVMIADYYVVHRGEYLPLVPHKNLFSWPAIASWGLGSLTAWFFAYHITSPLGATLTSFILTTLAYLTLHKYLKPRQ